MLVSELGGGLEGCRFHLELVLKLMDALFELADFELGGVDEGGEVEERGEEIGVVNFGFDKPLYQGPMLYLLMHM